MSRIPFFLKKDNERIRKILIFHFPREHWIFGNSYFQHFYSKFSNSLIVHQNKTKKITTVKEIWIYPVLISTDFDDFTSPFTPYFLFRLRIYYQTLEILFHRLSKQLELRQKYSVVHRIFNFPSLGIWISRWNTVSCVDILL